MNEYRLFVYQDIDNRWVWGVDVYDSQNNNWVTIMNGTKKYKFFAKKEAKKKYGFIIKNENSREIFISNPQKIKWEKINISHN